MNGRPDSRGAETTEHEPESLARSALDSLSANIAILDEVGVIIYVNKAWREFARSNGATKNVAEGANYLRVCESAAGEWSAEAAPFAKGIRAVLSGRQEEFALEYPCHSPMEQRWFIGRVTRFSGDGPSRAVVAHENITERKQAEKALRLRDRAVAASSNGIVITDPNQPDNPIVYVNPVFERMTGYSAKQIIGKNCRFLQGEDRDQPALKELRTAVREGRGCQVVLRNYKKNGTPFLNELSISPVRDEEGRLLNFVGVQNDITERERAEEALRDSEERYRALFEDNPSMYFTLDERGTVLSVNRFGAERLGYTSEELAGSAVLEIFHEEDREDVSRYMSACLRNPGETDGWEARKIHKDGNVLWVRENARVVRDPDGSKVILVTCEDVTERKEAERERARLLVREQAARAEAEAARQSLKIILDNLTEGVLVADPRGNVLFANPAAGVILGATSGEIPNELPDLWEDFNLPGAVAHCAWNGEGIEARVSYDESHLRVKLECLFNNERRDVLVVMKDLSEGHRLEANQQRFLANAAHELGTPLMAIMGAAELLATGEDENPTMRRRLLDHIVAESGRMQRLADALLRLSRVGWDLREPDQEVIDLRMAGQRAAEVMEPLVESAGLRLSLEGKGARVRVDPEWLQEVLLVLLSNAIKYSSRGGDIRLRVSGRAVIVEDEGAGISPVDLPHVFERFYRGKGSSEGFGLGLPICRELTEQMGGTISIRSREGIGTAVKVELPEADLDVEDTDSRG